MQEKISTLDVRRRLGDFLNRVSLRRDQFVIERKGRALAVLVSPETLAQLQRAARSHLLRALKGPSEPIAQGEADRLADEAKHASRRGRRR